MIDKHIKRPWPDEVKKALSDIRQGDVVEAPPFFYAHGGKIRLWDVPVDDEDGESPDGDGELDDKSEADEPESRVEEIFPADAPPFGIITSQTCDLDEQGPKPSNVWFQVSPVYPVPKNADEANRLLNKQSTVKLNGPGMPPGEWIADLRIELPVEKSWLVKKKRVRGFDSEAEAERFGLKLGRRRARPALANELVEHITGSLRQRKGIKKPADARKLAREVWKDDVYRVLLAIEAGTRLKPTAVKLHVVCQGTPTERAKEWFGGWEDEARHAAATVGIELHMTGFHDARTANLHEYDRWVELDFS
ncbi:MAG TPA: hypothetical protein VF533_13235 [Solirubrobacteraceae bacterium]